MSRFNTGNSVPSTDPRDRSDNSQAFDEAINSESAEFTDRLGQRRLTVQGMVDAATTGNPAVGAAQDALASAVVAKDEADRAETARDAATINADVYDDIATGLAAVSDGEQFQVVEGNEIVRYKRVDASTEEELARYPATAALANKKNVKGKQVAPCSVSGLIFALDGGDTRDTNSGKLRRVLTQNEEFEFTQPLAEFQPFLDEDGSINFAGDKCLICEKTADLKGVYHLPSVSSGRKPNPSGGFTNTGLARDDAGLWIIGHQGREDENDMGVFRPTVVILSPDFRTILSEIAVEEIYAGAGSLQGVAWDRTDDTIWLADFTEQTIRHITRAGVDVGDNISLTYSPNGLAYNSDDDELYISGSASNASLGDTLEVYDAELGTLKRTFRVPAFDIDHLCYSDGYLYITENAAIGTEGTVIATSISNTGGNGAAKAWETTKLKHAEAIEGVFVDGGKLYVNSDGGFHLSANPPLSLVCEYEISETPAGCASETVVVCGIFKSTASTNNREYIVSTPTPRGSEPGWGIAVSQGGNTISMRCNPSNDGPFQVTFPGYNTFTTDTKMMFAMELTQGEALPVMYINGEAVSSTATLGDLSQARNLYGMGEIWLGAISGFQGNPDDFGNMKLYGAAASSVLADREEIEGWLAHRTDNVDLLPVGHPYKGAPPA